MFIWTNEDSDDVDGSMAFKLTKNQKKARDQFNNMTDECRNYISPVENIEFLLIW